MSLVDYASSSDEEENDVVVLEKTPQQQEQKQPSTNIERQVTPDQPSPSPISHNNPQISASPPIPPPATPPSLPPPSFVKLPDASTLLNSPSVSFSGAGTTDHASRVAAAMAASSRKRDANAVVASSSSVPRGKVLKGSLPHLKNVPDTVDAVLLPPQLRGRSNIVTEDMGKLFVRKHAEPSSH